MNLLTESSCALPLISTFCLLVSGAGPSRIELTETDVCISGGTINGAAAVLPIEKDTTLRELVYETLRPLLAGGKISTRPIGHREGRRETKPSAEAKPLAETKPPAKAKHKNSSTGESSSTTRPAVICFGDSITKRGFPEELAQILDREVINAGVAGNTTRKAMHRLKTDVLDVRPKLAVILFGTNDARLAEEDVHVPVAQFEENLSKMVVACQGQNIDVILCTLPPIDEPAYFERHAREKFDQAGGLKQVLLRYRDAAVRVAETQSIRLVDLNRALLPHTGVSAHQHRC